MDTQYIRVRTPAELGGAIRARRKAQDLTLEQLSGLSGLGMRFLSELERGKTTVELGRTMEVAALLGLDVALSPRAKRTGVASEDRDDGAG